MSMSMKFPNVPLSRVLTPIERPETPQPGTTYRLFGVKWWGEGVYEREAVDGSQTQYAKLSRIEANDIVINKIWARHGSVAVVQENLAGCYGGSEFPTFLPDPTQLEPRWIHWLSKTAAFWAWCAEKSYGTSGKNRIRPEQFLAVEIPLPPLDEQHRIVAHIEALAARIAETRGLRQQAVMEVDFLFAQAIKRAFEVYQDKSVTLGDIFRVTNGSTPSRANPAYWDGDIKWVSSGEVAFNRITNTNEKITELGLANSSAKVYPPNTVLIAMIGQGKTRGQCAILDCYAATNQNVAGIHVYETEHIPGYVYWWLYARYAESRFKEIGTAYPALNGQRIKEMTIPLPGAYEQRRVVAHLDDLHARVDTLKRLQSETAAELDALLPAVLDRAFRGELL